METSPDNNFFRKQENFLGIVHTKEMVALFIHIPLNPEMCVIVDVFEVLWNNYRTFKSSRAQFHAIRINRSFCDLTLLGVFSIKG